MTPRYFQPRLRPFTTLPAAPLLGLALLAAIVLLLAAPGLTERRKKPAELPLALTPPESAGTVDVILDAQGRILFQDAAVTPGMLASRLRLLVELKPETAVQLRADAGRGCGDLLGVLDTVRAAGVKTVHLTGTAAPPAKAVAP
ncbi:MAG: biopolymer transporter ExbD [Lentisphaeria bacterium]